MSTRRRVMAALCAGVMVAGGPAAAMAAGEGSKAGPAEGSCSAALAVAHGVQVTVTRSDNLLLEKPGGSGVPVAQACVDYSLRDATAFASSPYPGPILVGLAARVPTGYPAYVHSRYPGAEESEVDEPGMKLLARSSETASTGRGQTALDPENGTASALAVADSSVDPAAGTSIATATAEVQPLTVKDVLRVGEVDSVAKARSTKDGTIERSSDLRVGRTTVAGQEVVITPRGVQAAGQTTAIPDTGSVEEQLAQAGVTVRYLRAEKTSAGILSAGIEINVENEDPGGAGTTVHYLLGRSFATAAPVDTTPTSRDGQSGLSGPPASGGEVGPVSPGSAPEAPVAEASVPDAAPPAPESAPQPKVAGEQGTAQSMALAGHPVDLGISAVYLVIVLGAVAMFVSGTLVRVLGVKTRWTS